MNDEQPIVTYTAGYEFKDGSYTESEQYKRYREAVDAIHREACRLQQESQS